MIFVRNRRSKTSFGTPRRGRSRGGFVRRLSLLTGLLGTLWQPATASLWQRIERVKQRQGRRPGEVGNCCLAVWWKETGRPHAPAGTPSDRRVRGSPEGRASPASFIADDVLALLRCRREPVPLSTGKLISATCRRYSRGTENRLAAPVDK